MTPAEIAAKLRPALVSFLRKTASIDGGCSCTWGYHPSEQLEALGLVELHARNRLTPRWPVTPLGRAVLTELDKDAAP